MRRAAGGPGAVSGLLDSLNNPKKKDGMYAL